jgi:hypothetical protein
MKNVKLDKKTKGIINKNDPFLRPKMVYDIEVFHNLYMFCFKSVDTGEETTITCTPNNVNGALTIKNIVEKYTLIGFNNYYYDDKILTHLLNGNNTCESIKEYNDLLISGEARWEPVHPSIVSLDIYTLLMTKMSLKALEAHSGVDIEETTIPFTYDGEFDGEMIKEVERYCKYDVDFTLSMIPEVKSQYNLKEYLYYKLPKNVIRGYRYTNATMSSYLFEGISHIRGVSLPRDEEMSLLPQDVQKLYIKKKNKVETGDDIITKTSIFTPSNGGAHGVNLNQKLFIDNGKQPILLWDFNSMYPNKIVQINLLNNKTNVMVDLLEERKRLTDIGDIDTATSAKLAANSVYGRLGSTTDRILANPDGLLTTCLSCQVLLLGVTYELEKLGCNIIQQNTDGVAFQPPEGYCAEELSNLKDRLEELYGIGLSEEKYKVFAQRSVNDYLAISPEGKPKFKGLVMKKAQYYINKNSEYKKIKDLSLANSSNDNGIVALMIYEIVKNLTEDTELSSLVSELQEICYEVEPTLEKIDELNKELKRYKEKIIDKSSINSVDINTMADIKRLFKSGDLDFIPNSWIESVIKLEQEIKDLRTYNKKYITHKLKGVSNKGLIELKYDEIESHILNNYSHLYDVFYNIYNIHPFTRLNKATNLVRKLGLYDGENVIELPNKNYRSYVANDGMRFVQNPKKLSEDSWNKVTHTSDTEVIYNGNILDRHNSDIKNDIKIVHYNKLVTKYLLATIVYGFNVDTIK